MAEVASVSENAAAELRRFAWVAAQFYEALADQHLPPELCATIVQDWATAFWDSE